MKQFVIALMAMCIFGACSSNAIPMAKAESGADDSAQTQVVPDDAAVATFAGGCFWCMEPPFEKLDGVYAVISGYTGGPEENPTYKQVAYGRTGHTESVQIFYNPQVISYETLLQVYWRQVNPTDIGGQFVDRGTQYRPEIFYHDETQKAAAEASKKALEESGRFDDPIVVPITKAGAYYNAEDYHQDYYKKSPGNYKRYRNGSGRDQFIKKVWGEDAHYAPKKSAYHKPSDTVLREKLSPMQYRVTQEDGTEPPFRNAYWDNKADGIYVDVVSGEPLFSSKHKYKSGTGWPSFYQPLVANHIVEKTDYKIGYARTEVRSKFGDSHLGHVFKDGPAPTGLRYCINSAALRFVPTEKLAEEGYAQYAEDFVN